MKTATAPPKAPLTKLDEKTAEMPPQASSQQSGVPPRRANRPSPIKRRRRRTQAEMEAIREAIVTVLAAEHPMTVRQVFYRLTSAGAIAKTEAEYKGTVGRLLTEMRRAGDIPYAWLTDATRIRRKPTTYSGPEEALRITAEAYRRQLWADTPVAVEIWVEKNALAGVLADVTEDWDVPLLPVVGCPSLSYLYSAAMSIVARAENKQRTLIYYFGDHDPTGLDIDRQIVTSIAEAIWSRLPEDEREPTLEEEFAHWADFERVAVTEDQIREWNLPTRPTKKTDSRSKTFEGESVELDAIPPDRLRELARDVIEQHVDHYQLDVLRKVEAEEREGLLQLAGRAL